METFWQDVRFSVRMLAKNPGFTVAAVLCLMLGIGATTCIFSVVNAVLLRPLPYKHPEQLIRVYTEFPNFPHGGLRRFWASPPEFLDLRRDAHSWASLDAWTTGGANIAGDTEPVRITAGFVSGGLLNSLGVTPALGRVISPSDDLPGAQTVTDISYGTWRSVFGGDPNIVGRETMFNGNKCVIIGVMPRGFEFPPGETDPPQVWSALKIDPANPGGRGSHYLYLLGRLQSGTSASQAQGELSALVQAYAEKRAPKTHSFNPDPKAPNVHTLVSYPLQAEVVSSVRPALLMLLGAVAFVLLIACVNVANLLLARAEARRREIAIRSALGANVGRLARQFATEGVLLALIGAVLGLALAFGGLRLIQLTNAGGLPRAAEIGIDWRVLLFTLGTSIVTGVLFGLAPFFPLFFEQLTESLKNTSGGATGGSGAQVFRRILVTGELALALVLLIGCGLMIRAFWKLQEVHTGLNAQNVLTMRVALPRSTYSKNEQADNFWIRLEDRLHQIPGVESAALVSGLAPQRPPNMNDTGIKGLVVTPGGPIPNVDFYQAVSKDYFSTMGIRLMAGRLFDDRDVHGAPDVVIINQTMARTFWPGQDPIGRRIQPGNTNDWTTVVGIVDDVKNAGLDRPTGTEIYLPYRQSQGAGSRNMYAILRAKGDPRNLAGAVRQEMNAIDPALPLSQIRLMDDVLSAAQSRPRFLTLLLALFSCVALAIATIGIYGVISYSVERRSREFGLRMALGAQPSDVLSLVMKQGAGLALIGVVVGLVAAFALTRLMTTLLFGVTPTDLPTFAVVTAILTIVALAASYIPARRATKVDPIQTLRYE
jgi:putative ABC transport system permease protein